MKKFRAGELQILVATDMMARGIDVKNVDSVINYEEPREIDAYVHRIGRTGRAGAKGKAYTLLSFDIEEELRKLIKVSNGKIQEAKVEGFEYDKNDRGTPMGNFGGAFNPDANKVSTRFFMTLGEMDGLNNVSLKEFIISNTDIKAEDILDVYVKDKYSFVTILNSKKHELNNLHDYQGRAFKISEASERQPKFGGGNRGGSRGGFGGGHKSFGDRRGGGSRGGYSGGHKSYSDRREGGHEKSFGSHGHRSFGGGDRTGYRGKPKANGSFHKFGNRES
jgi:superfamily II DNA/RNA helicase